MSRSELRQLTPVDSATEELLGGLIAYRADEESTDFGTASENESKRFDLSLIPSLAVDLVT